LSFVRELYLIIGCSLGAILVCVIIILLQENSNLSLLLFIMACINGLLLFYYDKLMSCVILALRVRVSTCVRSGCHSSECIFLVRVRQ
jgi:hypothetical protein